MKNRLKKILILACVLMLSLTGLITVNVFAATEKVAGSSVKSEDIQLAGASIRIADDDKNGIRFPIRIERSVFETNVVEGVTTGTLVIPKAIYDAKGYTESTFTVDTAITPDSKIKNVDTTNIWVKVNAEGKVVADDSYTAYQSTVYVYNVSEVNYSKEFCVRGYVKANDTVTYSSILNDRSISFVASSALKDKVYDEGTPEYELLAKYVYDKNNPDTRVLGIRSTDSDSTTLSFDTAKKYYTVTGGKGEIYVKLNPYYINQLRATCDKLYITVFGQGRVYLRYNGKDSDQNNKVRLVIDLTSLTNNNMEICFWSALDNMEYFTIGTSDKYDYNNVSSYFVTEMGHTYSDTDGSYSIPIVAGDTKQVIIKKEYINDLKAKNYKELRLNSYAINGGALFIFYDGGHTENNLYVIDLNACDGKSDYVVSLWSNTASSAKLVLSPVAKFNPENIETYFTISNGADNKCTYN